ncbi:MAG: hypothetical protein WC516_04540 [Patescibacteria group bacterium]
MDYGETPFHTIGRWIAHISELLELNITDMVLYKLRETKTGNYNKINKCLRELVCSNINLRTCSVEDLEKIYGIGPKTARFFILWTRPNAKCAALDVHVLRWLGKQGYKVPKSTPNGKQYKELEQAFLDEADKLNMTPSELDKKIWVGSSNYGKKYGKWNPDDFVSIGEDLK